jgi:glycosyltransferase involved in cell wall biosynthesis
MKSTQISVLCCYEDDCGGETLATQNILFELKHHAFITVVEKSLPPLRDTDFIRMFIWTIHSIIQWFTFIYIHKNTQWIYTTTFTAGVAASIIVKFTHQKIIWHYHGSRIPPMVNNQPKIRFFTHSMKRFFVIILHKFFIKHVTHIYIPTIESIQELHPLGIDKNKLIIVPNGVDLERFSTNYSKKSSREYNILLVGRIEKNKNIHLVLSSFVELLKISKRFRLTIVYLEPNNAINRLLLDELMYLTKKNNVSKHVRWIKDPPCIEHLYKESNMTISLSKIENYSLVMLEAFASKTLYVSSPAGNSTAILRQINQQQIITSEVPKKIAQQIAQLASLSDADLRTILEAQYNYAKKHTWRSTVNKIIHVLQEQYN